MNKTNRKNSTLEKHKQIFDLIKLGFTYLKIGETMGISKSAVSGFVYRGKDKMGWHVKKIDLDRLEALYKEGWTYTQLGSEFNCTNGAIGFQIKKLKKLGRIDSRKDAVIPKVKVNKLKLPKTIIDNTLAWKSFKKIPLPDWDYVSETGKTLLDLKSNECHWPCKDDLYCGKMPVAGKSYCEEHQRKSEGKK